MSRPPAPDRPAPPTDEWDDYLRQLDQFRRSQFKSAPRPPEELPDDLDVAAFDADLDRYVEQLEHSAPAAAAPATPGARDDDFNFDDDDDEGYRERDDAPPRYVPDDDDEPLTAFVDPMAAPASGDAGANATDEDDGSDETADHSPQPRPPGLLAACVLWLFALGVPAGAALALSLGRRFVPAPAMLDALHAPLPWWPQVPTWAWLAGAVALLVALLFIAGEWRNPRRRLRNAFTTWLLVFPFWLLIATATALLAPFGWSAAWTTHAGTPHSLASARLTPVSWEQLSAAPALAGTLCQRPALVAPGPHVTPFCTDGFPAASTATLTGLATPAGLLVDTLTPECYGTECNKRSAYCRKRAFVQ